MKRKKHQLPITNPQSKKKVLKRQNNTDGNSVVSTQSKPIDISETPINNVVIVNQSIPPVPVEPPVVNSIHSQPMNPVITKPEDRAVSDSSSIATPPPLPVVVILFRLTVMSKAEV